MKGFGASQIHSHPFTQAYSKPLRPSSQNGQACSASFSGPKQALREETLPLSRDRLIFKVVSLLFAFPPFWSFAKSKAIKKIADRGHSIGIDQAAEVNRLRGSVDDWESIAESIRDPDLQYPEYYVKPFHAYDEGNLSWEAAFQVPSAAKLVHAPVMDPESKDLRADGDDQMRHSYSKKMLEMINQAGGKNMRNVVDLGCATGLSSLELQRMFPEASILGIDLSPYFLSVGKIMHQTSNEDPERGIVFKHGRAEETGLPASGTDLVSICLVLHEVPQHGTKAILEEAYRILRPGGFLTIMEMNPRSQRFQRMFKNPFAFVPFKATEPWLEEYINLDLGKLIGDIGFSFIQQEQNTPGHFTLVARKPEDRNA